MQLLYKQINSFMTDQNLQAAHVLAWSGLREPGLKELLLVEGLGLDTPRSRTHMNELQTKICAYRLMVTGTLVTSSSIAMQRERKNVRDMKKMRGVAPVMWMIVRGTLPRLART